MDDVPLDKLMGAYSTNLHPGFEINTDSGNFLQKVFWADSHPLFPVKCFCLPAE